MNARIEIKTWVDWMIDKGIPTQQPLENLLNLYDQFKEPEQKPESKYNDVDKMKQWHKPMMKKPIFQQPEVQVENAKRSPGVAKLKN